MLPTARELAPHNRVFAVDLPGFGRSDDPPAPLDVEGLAGSLRAWLAERLGSAIIVANSFGCQIVVDLAMRWPSLVQAMVLAGPTTDPGARSLLGQAVRWLRNSVWEPPRLAPVIARDYLDAGLRRVVVAFRSGLADPIEEKLPEVRTPTLVVRGERDAIVSGCWARRAAELLPRGELAVIPEAVHTVNFGAARQLADIVRGFLEGLDVAGIEAPPAETRATAHGR